MVLAKACLKYGVNKFVFSSSATVYGDNKVPFVETMDLLPTTNPYGETNAINERILTDIAKANPDFSVFLLRYFNPIGAHESGLIGEEPDGIPNNLMPYITQVAKGHVAAIEKLTKGVHIYNLGTGKGTSVLQLVHAFEKANDIKIPYTFVDRRPGDIAECYADVSKVKRELGWTAKKGIIDMCRDAWRLK